MHIVARLVILLVLVAAGGVIIYEVWRRSQPCGPAYLKGYCSGNLKCVAGECQMPECGPKAPNGTCGVGKKCQDGDCVSICDPPCSSTEKCEETTGGTFHCKPRTTTCGPDNLTGECTDSNKTCNPATAQCEVSRLTCGEGNLTGTCPANEHCENGKCLPNTTAVESDQLSVAPCCKWINLTTQENRTKNLWLTAEPKFGGSLSFQERFDGDRKDLQEWALIAISGGSSKFRLLNKRAVNGNQMVIQRAGDQAQLTNLREDDDQYFWFDGPNQMHVMVSQGFSRNPYYMYLCSAGTKASMCRYVPGSTVLSTLRWRRADV